MECKYCSCYLNDININKVITTPGLSGNGEKEYYLPEQVYVENGTLVLRSDNITYVSVRKSSIFIYYLF